MMLRRAFLRLNPMTGPVKLSRRWNATKTNHTPNRSAASTVSLLASGAIAGGLVTFAACSAWYNRPNDAQAVSPVIPTRPAISTKRYLSADPQPSQAIVVRFLHFYLDPFLAIIPGGTQAFDKLVDGIAKTHGDELNRILIAAYNDVNRVILEGGGVNVRTAHKLMDIARNLLIDLTRLSQDIGVRFLEDNPNFVAQIDAGIRQLQELRETYSPQARKFVKDGYRQLKGLFGRGGSTEAPKDDS
ncbi:hypothetical protein FN846DRAFT_386073 [Sphaerosporella brunnea]|uniref:Uncharacterized protein n=1 Tax=Sphaerosporella brunnea TaxID=1250544 RepID=A0A5J5EID5_9PEZI|nr:hypothetical protein FN846DRAFT_386073 [Sphaerosporella brunnea]